jgi:hypothetical protein
VVEKKRLKQEKRKKGEGETVDWNNAIEKGTIKLTGLITLYLLISRITIK